MKFKTLILGALASVFALGSALAADLPSRKGPPGYPPPPPVFSWEGWHIGVNGGYGGGSVSTTSSIWAFPTAGVVVPGNPPVVLPGFPGFAVATQNSIGTSGFVAGVQYGYLWHLSNNVVVGNESDFQYADVSGREAGGFGAGFGGARQRLDWFGTERLRLGYAFGRFLPYVTGGLAYGQIRADGQQFFGGFLFPVSASSWHAGWTLGAGLEYAFLDNMSIKAEYLYTEMQGARGFGPGFAPGLPLAFRSFQSGAFGTHIARVGLNYNIQSIGAIFGISGL
jgi:outer membrane immunogenic protein